MFYVNVLHNNTRIEPKTSLANNLTLTTNIPLGTKEGALFFRFIADTKLKREKIKNLVVKQCNSPQGCTIKLETRKENVSPH
jgi:hypothetical protein